MEDITCTKCKNIYPPTDFYPDKRRKNGKQSNCRYCMQEATQRWRENNQDYILQHSKEYHEAHTDEEKEWRKNHREYMRNNLNIWRKTPKGRESNRKQNAKRRKLGFNKLYPNPFENEKIEWHHINDTDVVALPKWLHRLYPPIKRYWHRENLKPYVELFYNIVEM